MRSLEEALTYLASFAQKSQVWVRREPPNAKAQTAIQVRYTQAATVAGRPAAERLGMVLAETAPDRVPLIKEDHLVGLRVALDTVASMAGAEAVGVVTPLVETKTDPVKGATAAVTEILPALIRADIGFTAAVKSLSLCCSDAGCLQ